MKKNNKLNQLKSNKKTTPEKGVISTNSHLNQNLEIKFFYDYPEALLYTGKDSKILAVNYQFSQLFGYQPEDINGKKIENIILLSQDQEVAENKKGLLSKLGKCVYHQAILRKGDNSFVDIEISISPIHSDEKDDQGSLITFKEITHRNENKKLNQVLCNISKAVISNISSQELYQTIYHEINTIIDAKNFHIALLNREKKKVEYNYFVDQKDELDKDTNRLGITDTLANYCIKPTA